MVVRRRLFLPADLDELCNPVLPSLVSRLNELSLSSTVFQKLLRCREPSSLPGSGFILYSELPRRFGNQLNFKRAHFSLMLKISSECRTGWIFLAQGICIVARYEPISSACVMTVVRQTQDGLFTSQWVSTTGMKWTICEQWGPNYWGHEEVPTRIRNKILELSKTPPEKMKYSETGRYLIRLWYSWKCDA